jgi:hypothetical protein
MSNPSALPLSPGRLGLPSEKKSSILKGSCNITYEFKPEEIT